MKAVLISIQPQWVEKIVSGGKTIEIRKTRPQIETPFKCYIYQTKGKKDKVVYASNYLQVICGKGKVIGEFVCDRIETFIDYDEHNEPYWNFSAELEEIERVQKETCLTLEQIIDYVGDSKNAYGWHISQLKIYDRPKHLWEFYTRCKLYERGDGSCDDKCLMKPFLLYDDDDCEGNRPLRIAPQSWCYVEVQRD